MQDESITTPVTETGFELRCWQCQKFLAVLIDFYGVADFHCPRCKSKSAWRGSQFDSRESQRMSQSRRHFSVLIPRPCSSCDKLGVFASRFRGTIFFICKRCRHRNYFHSHDSLERIQNALRGTPEPPTDWVNPDDRESLFEALDERWETMLRVRAKTRAEVAVGLRFDVFRRDGFKCRYCGRSVDDGAILHADHVIPASKGGPTSIDNLVTACIECNLGKSDKDLT